jgi:hypothetical protein
MISGLRCRTHLGLMAIAVEPSTMSGCSAEIALQRLRVSTNHSREADGELFHDGPRLEPWGPPSCDTFVQQATSPRANLQRKRG